MRLMKQAERQRNGGLQGEVDGEETITEVENIAGMGHLPIPAITSDARAVRDRRLASSTGYTNLFTTWKTDPPDRRQPLSSSRFYYLSSIKSTRLTKPCKVGSRKRMRRNGSKRLQSAGSSRMRRLRKPRIVWDTIQVKLVRSIGNHDTLQGSQAARKYLGSP